MRLYNVFFSHGGDDTYVVEQFLKPKIETSGARVFLDAGQILYGDDFRQTLLAELLQCDELLVLFTRSSLGRPWVFAEVGATIMRGKRIVAMTYGLTEGELQQLGVLSLLGTSNLLRLEELDSHVGQLTARVRAHNNG